MSRLSKALDSIPTPLVPKEADLLIGTTAIISLGIDCQGLPRQDLIAEHVGAVLRELAPKVYKTLQDDIDNLAREQGNGN